MTDYWLVIGMVTAVGIWLVLRGDNPAAQMLGSFGEKLMPRPRTRRDELREARRRVQRQLEILDSPVRKGDFNEVATDTRERLHAVLAEIEAELRTLPPK